MSTKLIFFIYGKQNIDRLSTLLLIFSLNKEHKERNEEREKETRSEYNMIAIINEFLPQLSSLQTGLHI